ncbi:hypothetical protein BO83DRAFT_407409 [Aspergillus eucalypticola CBS 122712]|uniref:Uncharacterized protein n=1 Tax=Aspergillus eucalypticola (strain CBS 122712 / IBT 29274) TaxID=1448314 RepID=A0A317VS36_ASPEC|nr:uncharacterized protein BO83DRAFT_407409 [Aspergillus eucalypticola CBS 122712]PWY75698.1 hypothetical protein BO83DRAFT_407409 [Aspergillus eucalypticola CBS 122712]
MLIPLAFLRRTKSFRPLATSSAPGPREHKKVLVTGSLQAVLWRCAIHLLPIIMSVTIVTINLNGRYIGADLMSPVKSETINLLLLQLIAKSHEIMIVASLSVMVMDFVRHELMFGGGVPLGLIGAGINFNRFDFFLRKEFYGSLGYAGAHDSKLRKFLFVGLVVVAGLVAFLAGPASAVFLVPKSQGWRVGSKTFSIVGEESQFWPDDLSGNMSELHRLCGNGSSSTIAFCPAGGYHSLWTYWGTKDRTSFQNAPSYAKKLSGSRFYWPISSPSSLIPPLYALGDTRNGTNGNTFLVQAHAAVTTALQRLADNWWNAFLASADLPPSQVDDRIVSAEVRSAIVRLRCSDPQLLRTLDQIVTFPSIPRESEFGQSFPLKIDGLHTNPSDHLRFSWVRLPSGFGPVSIGGLFESAWGRNGTEKTSSSARIVVGCSVQAGWVPSTLFTDKYSFWTGWYPWNIKFNSRTPSWHPESNGSTNGRVSFGVDWLDLLTPEAPVRGSNTWRPSTIESIFSNTALLRNTQSDNTTRVTSLEGWIDDSDLGQKKVAIIEAIIGSVVVDGLSRTGSYQLFTPSDPSCNGTVANSGHLPEFEFQIPTRQQTSSNASCPSPHEVTTIKADMKISGFSLQSSLASYLALPILLMHIMLTVIHIVLVIYRKHTSGSWTSLGEIIALAQNSQPAPIALENTGAGIRSAKTYARVAKVRIRKAAPMDRGHVELLFDDLVQGIDQPNSTEQELIGLQTPILRHPATWPGYPARTPTPGNGSMYGLNPE